MAFDYNTFKARWRELAAERGVDPQNGATGFQVATARAEAQKRTHHLRARLAVYADAETLSGEQRYSAVGALSVEEAARRAWWAHGDMWHDGGRQITIRKPVAEDQESLISRTPPTDYQAVKNILMDALRIEGREDEAERIDNETLARQAWNEDGVARRKRKADMPIQTAFAFAFA